MAHYNYVISFTDGRIKIGRTGNLKRRLSDLSRQTKKEGCRSYCFDEGSPVSKGVSIVVETKIRRTLIDHALPGSLEWFYGPRSTAAAIAGMTNRFQQQIIEAMAA